MKVFFALCVFALAALCAAEDGPYLLIVKDVCDSVQEMNTIDSNGKETKSDGENPWELFDHDGSRLRRPCPA